MPDESGDGSRHDPRDEIVEPRPRPVVTLGGLAGHVPVAGDRLVAARDRHGRSWWIPAAAVWSDAAADRRPQHPHAAGLATARTREQAWLAGLSDRLGWEAWLELQRGGELPRLHRSPSGVDNQLVVLDGRVGHDVPTVVMLGPDLVRWGAGPTWDAAWRRAVYGRHGGAPDRSELGVMAASLAASGVDVAAVDLGTPSLRRAAVVRWSVQLLLAG